LIPQADRAGFMGDIDSPLNAEDRVPRFMSATNAKDRLAVLWVRIAALCVGASCSLHLLGTEGLFQSILDPMPRTTVMVVAVAMLAAALGPWLPLQIVARWARSKSAAQTVIPKTILFGPPTPAAGSARQGLVWIVLAVMCVVTGAVAVILLWAIAPIERLHTWALDSFFLSRTELLTVDLGSVAASLALPWLCIGLTVTVLYVLAAGHEVPGREVDGLAGSLLLGAALGALVAETSAFRGSPGRTALVGVLPLFALAVVGVLRAGRRRSLDEDEQPVESQLPLWAPEAGHILLVCLAVWGAVVAMHLTVWPRVIHTGLEIVPLFKPFLGAWLLMTLSVGVLFGGWWARRSDQPVGGAGPSLVVAGLSTGVGIVGCGMIVGGIGSADPSRAGVVTAMVLGSLAVVGMGNGWAYPYLKRALMVQAGSPVVTCAQVIAAVFTGAAAGTVLAMTWITPSGGTLVSLSVAGLLALATGGLLIIFDVGHAYGRRGLRIGGVFVALVAMMIGLPAAGRWWFQWRTPVAAFREGTWLTATVGLEPNTPHLAILPQPSMRSTGASAAASTVRAFHAVMQLRGPVRNCWLITAGGLAADGLDAARCDTIRTSYYDPVVGRFYRVGRRQEDFMPPDGSAPALLAIRADREYYDLIVIESVPGRHGANHAIWSLETLSRMERHLAPGGLLALLVRPADCSRTELIILVATFLEAADNFTRAAVVGQDADQILVLFSTAKTPPALDWDAAARAGMLRTGPLKTFLRSSTSVTPHSLRRPVFASTNPQDNGGLELAHYVCRTSEWQVLSPTPRPVPIRPPVFPSSGPMAPSAKRP